MYLDVYRELFTTDPLDPYSQSTQETFVRTTSFSRVAVMGIASLVVAGLVSGCATKKTKSANAGSASTSSSAAATSSSAAAAPSTAPSETATSSTVKATGGGKFCQQVASSINSSVAQAAATGTGVDAIKKSVQEFRALESSVLKAAPGEIKPDLVTLFGALDQLYAGLEKANYDFTKVDPSIEAPLETPAVKAAEQKVDDYVKNTCGIDIGGPSAASS